MISFRPSHFPLVVVVTSLFTNSTPPLSHSPTVSSSHFHLPLTLHLSSTNPCNLASFLFTLLLLIFLLLFHRLPNHAFLSLLNHPFSSIMNSLPSLLPRHAFPFIAVLFSTGEVIPGRTHLYTHTLQFA